MKIRRLQLQPTSELSNQTMEIVERGDLQMKEMLTSMDDDDFGKY